MGYLLGKPLFFGPLDGPERLPSVQIGDFAIGGVVSCDLSFVGREHSMWRLRITVRYRPIYDVREAVRQPVRHYGRGRQAAEVLGSTMSFLRADADSYRRTMGTSPPPDGWIFNVTVAEWAYLNDGELDAMADLLAGAK